ncbi:MAG: hypothetical protein FJ044_00910 [Candidatus Cloacimonetes bacterium]|nr:hypothetical protein [Candidatus Cloacimonadota bacterium]
MALYPSRGEGGYVPPEATRSKETYDEDAARRAVAPLCQEICTALGDKLSSGEREYSFTKGDTETTVVFAPRVFAERLKPTDIKHIFAYNKKTGIHFSALIDTERQVPTDVVQNSPHHRLEIKREYGGSYAVHEWQLTPLTKETRVAKALRGGSLGTGVDYTKEGGLRFCVGTYQRKGLFEKWRRQWQERLGTGEVREIEPERESIIYERKGNEFTMVRGRDTWLFLNQNGMLMPTPRIEGRSCYFEIASQKPGVLI